MIPEMEEETTSGAEAALQITSIIFSGLYQTQPEPFLVEIVTKSSISTPKLTFWNIANPLRKTKIKIGLKLQIRIPWATGYDYLQSS